MDRARLRQIIKEELSRAVNEGWNDEYEPDVSRTASTSYHRSGALRGLETGPAVRTGLTRPKSGPTFWSDLDERSARQFNRMATSFMEMYGGDRQEFNGPVQTPRPVPSKTKGQDYQGEYTLYRVGDSYVAQIMIPEIRYDEEGLPAETPYDALMNAIDLLTPDYNEGERVPGGEMMLRSMGEED